MFDSGCEHLFQTILKSNFNKLKLLDITQCFLTKKLFKGLEKFISSNNCLIETMILIGIIAEQSAKDDIEVVFKEKNKKVIFEGLHSGIEVLESFHPVEY